METNVLNEIGDGIAKARGARKVERSSDAFTRDGLGLALRQWCLMT